MPNFLQAKAEFSFLAFPNIQHMLFCFKLQYI